MSKQALVRKKPGSHRRKKAGKLVGKTHRKVANQRRDFLRKASRKLVNAYGTIVFEELQPANMSKRPKPKQDENGNPQYTSQVCSGCGTVVKKELSERWHECSCGCSLDRDHNAALNILALGRSAQQPRC